MEYKCKCEALIDQGKYIGEDPVGHACLHEAEVRVVDGMGTVRWLCVACCDDLERYRGAPPGRCTLRATAVAQDEHVQRIIRQMETYQAPAGLLTRKDNGES